MSSAGFAPSMFYVAFFLKQIISGDHPGKLADRCNMPVGDSPQLWKMDNYNYLAKPKKTSIDRRQLFATAEKVWSLSSTRRESSSSQNRKAVHTHTHTGQLLYSHYSPAAARVMTTKVHSSRCPCSSAARPIMSSVRLRPLNVLHCTTQANKHQVQTDATCQYGDSLQLWTMDIIILAKLGPRPTSATPLVFEHCKFLSTTSMMWHHTCDQACHCKNWQQINHQTFWL